MECFWRVHHFLENKLESCTLPQQVSLYHKLFKQFVIMHFPFRRKTDHKARGTKAGRKREILLQVGREQFPGSGQHWQTQQRFGAGSSNFWLCRNLSGSPLKYDSQSVVQDFCLSIPQLWHALGRSQVQTPRSEQQKLPASQSPFRVPFGVSSSLPLCLP